MMKIKQLHKISCTFFLCFLFSLLLMSCQKDFSIDLNPPPPPNNVVDSNYLDKIYQIEKYLGVFDTISVWTYNYDALKRVTSLIEVTSPNEINIRFFYFYNGNDTLPYKSIEYQNSLTINDTFVNFHFYNALGDNVKDSILSLSGFVNTKEIKQYSYSTNKIIGFTKKTLLFPLPSTTVYRADTAILDANKNMISCKSYETDLPNSQNYNNYTFSTFTYDNNLSPFHKLSNYKCYGVLPHMECFILELPTSLNNRLKTHQVYFSSSTNTYDEDFTGDYIYRTNGYPKEILALDPFSPGDFEKYSFTYKTL